MKKSIGIVVRTVLWIGTASVLLACLLLARLLFAPLDLGFAREQLIEQAEAILPGWEIKFDRTEIGWDWRSVRPWVSITDLQLTDRRDRLTARIPHAQVGVGFSSILGDISLSTVELDAANMVVTDLAGFSDATGSGMFSDLFGEGGIPKPAVFRPVTEGFSRFSRRLMQQAPALNSILLTSSVVEIVRGEDYPNARFAVPRLELGKDGDQLSLEALVDVELAGNPVQLRMQGGAEPDVGELNVKVSFSQMRPKDLQFQVAMPEVVTYLDFPITLDLELELASNAGLRAARFNLDIDDGYISHPVRFPDPAPISFGAISGYFVAAEDMLVFEEIELQTPKRTVAGQGRLQWPENSDMPTVRLSLVGDAATIAEVKQYWPIATYPDGTPRGARVWVEDNMIDGLARNARFDVDWSPVTGGGYVGGSAYRLTFDFADVDTKYLRDMPPIKAASGSAVLTRHFFDLTLDSGEVLGMPIAGSKAHMYNIHHPGEGIGRFDIAAKGDVPTIMELIAYDPLNIPQKMNFDTARLDGQATVQVVVEVPLVKGVAKDQISYEVTAGITNTVVKDLLGGEGIREGDMLLTLDANKLSMEGNAVFNGVPLALYWRENFEAGRNDPAADTTEVVMSGQLDEVDIKAFGVDVSKFLEGKVPGEATFVGRNFKFNHGYFTADATAAVLKASEFAWRKPASAPATVTGVLAFKDGFTELVPLVVEGEDIDFSGSFSFGAQGTGSFSGDLSARNLGGHKLSGTVAYLPGMGTDVRIVAEQFNAGAYLADKDDTKASNDISDAAPDGRAAKERTNISLQAGRLLLLNGEYLEHATIDTVFRDGEPKKLDFKANVGGTAKQLEMIIAEQEGAGQALTVTSPDAGQFLRGLGLFAHLRDGSLTMSGTTTGWGEHLGIKGQAKIRDSLLVPRDHLGPAVSEGVVSGLTEFLKDGPVELDKIDIPFDYQDALLDLGGLKANGPTLGMTMEGQISARESKINVNGVFVPAYGLNSLLGKIPLVGTLLTGGEGKGVFGVSYRVKGQLESPEFTINPVSGLAPGFLRLLFEGRKGKISDVETPDEPKSDSDVAEPGSEPADPEKEPQAEPEPTPQG